MSYHVPGAAGAVLCVCHAAGGAAKSQPVNVSQKRESKKRKSEVIDRKDLDQNNGQRFRVEEGL